MSYKLSIGFEWQGDRETKSALERVRIAEDAGVDTVFVPEAWGQDAFAWLALIADRTSRIKLGTGIVNYYSRTPAALAQHFGTLDIISEGRAIIGLGASSANVIEHFHGIPFNPTLARMRETIEIINTLIAEVPLNYKGKWFDLQRGFTLRFKTYRPHIPVYVASFRPRAVKVVAEVADGWIPMMTPMDKLKPMIDGFRAHAAAHGRDGAALTVCTNGGIVVAKDREQARQAGKANTAFYIARMGDYYYEQICDMGFKDEADTVRRAWAEGGSKAAYAAVPDHLCDALGAYGSVEECRDRLQAQAEAGINLHRVSVQGAESSIEEGRLLEALAK
jgi:alkanesulfonate monooxygenase SsuD/methylene tetrahydromethanopterin reductase-like flavin-dependent oxidoreductase (luciferase family)